jgi:hypothetical protein
MPNPLVLGFIVCDGIYPAFAVVVIQRGEEILVVFAMCDPQVVNIASVDELLSTTKYFIEHKPISGREEYSSTKLAFAISCDEILFLETNDLREELLWRAAITGDIKTSDIFSETANDILAMY